MSEPFVADSQLLKSGICGSEYGDLYWTQNELNQVVLEAQDLDYRVAFHAMGDQAIELVLNAIESALDGQPNDIFRHQIEHNSMARPDQLSRYEELDILASVRGYGDFCLPEGEVLPSFGPDRTDWYANRYALANLNIHAYLETDYGWTVDPDDRFVQRNLDPVVHLFGLVTHKYVQADGTICDPVSWTAVHEISVERALEMMTIEPAYAVSMEDHVGSLAPGKFADLIILSDNPLTIPPDQLKDLEVWMTMIGGTVEYCKPEIANLCPEWPVALD
jgi:predicted amidohydrolase YtcJ